MLPVLTKTGSQIRTSDLAGLWRVGEGSLLVNRHSEHPKGRNKRPWEKGDRARPVVGKAGGPQAWNSGFSPFFTVHPQVDRGRHPRHPPTCSLQQNRRRKKRWTQGMRPFPAEEAWAASPPGPSQERLLVPNQIHTKAGWALPTSPPWGSLQSFFCLLCFTCNNAAFHF